MVLSDFNYFVVVQSVVELGLVFYFTNLECD